MMKTRRIVAALSLFGFLVALGPSATAMDENFDIRAAVQNAATASDHKEVAKYFEDAANELQAKVYEKKELLQHYQDKSYLYGRQAQDLQAHTDALLRNYENAVKVSMREAATHRQMALNLEKNNPATSDRQQLNAMNKSRSGHSGIIIAD
jgi:hypothetical protein